MQFSPIASLAGLEQAETAAPAGTMPGGSNATNSCSPGRDRAGRLGGGHGLSKHPNHRGAAAAPSASSDEDERRLLCDEGDPLCAETADAIGYEGRYTGHDEPSVLFYSDRPGSGTTTATG